MSDEIVTATLNSPNAPIKRTLCFKRGSPFQTRREWRAPRFHPVWRLHGELGLRVRVGVVFNPGGATPTSKQSLLTTHSS